MVRPIYSLLFLFVIKYELLSHRIATFLIMTGSTLANIFMILHSESHEILFFKIYTSQFLVLPHSSCYLIRGRREYLLIFICFGFIFYAFWASLGQTITFTFSLTTHGIFLSSAFIHQALTLILFRLYQLETNVYLGFVMRFLNSAENKSIEKTNFISRMSHDLRTPLHGLLSLVTLLRQTHITEEQGYYLNVMDSCGNLILDVVMKILDISKIESGKFEAKIENFSLFDFVQELFDSLSILADSKNNEFLIDFKLDSQGYDIKGDQIHLREILTNVIYFIYLFFFKKLIISLLIFEFFFSFFLSFFLFFSFFSFLSFLLLNLFSSIFLLVDWKRFKVHKKWKSSNDY